MAEKKVTIASAKRCWWCWCFVWSAPSWWRARPWAEIRQQAQRALDKQRNILAVSGLMHPGMDADAVADTFAARITPRLVNLATGELLEKDPGKFNQAQALKRSAAEYGPDASQIRLV